MTDEKRGEGKALAPNDKFNNTGIALGERAKNIVEIWGVGKRGRQPHPRETTLLSKEDHED